jgi:hypothetical protein
MKSFVARLVAVTFACTCLMSCWIPEKFTAALDVKKDKTFKFTYGGTIGYGAALGAIKQGKPASAEDEVVKKGEAELRKDPGFKSVEYAGKGRFKVEFEQSGPLENGKRIFLDLLEFGVGPDGRISILGKEITAEAQKGLATVDFSIDGTLTLTSELKAAEHNATSTRGLDGPIGTYEWKISLDKRERLKIVLQP